MVLVVLVTALVFATMLIRTSIVDGTENRPVYDRAQLQLLANSVLEAAKLKIRTHPAELYRAFYYKEQQDNDELYNKFLEDLNLAILDARVDDNSRWNAAITNIERLGVKQSASGVGGGFVEDYYRITASATIVTEGYGFEKLTTDMQSRVTLRIIRTGT